MQRQQNHRARAVQLNIVSMIDVFAVLVFFLLVSSSLAAARLNVISLNLPAPDRAPPPEQPQQQLTVVVRSSGLEVSDRGGAVRNFANTPSGYNLQAFSDLLVEIKKSLPSEQGITLLMEPEIAYDNVVKIMDAVRIAPAEARASGLPRELFPLISIGDAPILAGAAPAGASTP